MNDTELKNLERKNHHCTCIEVNSVGVMIEGASGAGKTSLALGLLNATRIRHAGFNFVCDDQALMKTVNGELWASAPKSLAGKVELFGVGIADIRYIAQCKIDLVCELVNQADIIRHPTDSQCQRFGVELDYIQTPEQHEAQGIRILLHKLSLPL